MDLLGERKRQSAGREYSLRTSQNGDKIRSACLQAIDRGEIVRLVPVVEEGRILTDKIILQRSSEGALPHLPGRKDGWTKLSATKVFDFAQKLVAAGARAVGLYPVVEGGLHWDSEKWDVVHTYESEEGDPIRGIDFQELKSIREEESALTPLGPVFVPRQ